MKFLNYLLSEKLFHYFRVPGLILMKINNRLRVLIGKFFYKKTILFSRRYSREHQIIKNVNTCFPCFSNFKKVNLNNFYLIFPLTENASNYFNEHYSYLNYKKAIVPSNKAIEICLDKKIFTDFLLKNGFEDCAIKKPKNLQYPYILKKRIDENGSKTIIIYDEASEYQFKNELHSNEFFVQEYIEGQDEYAMHIIMYQGEIVFYKTMKYTFAQKNFVKGERFKQYSQEIVDHGHFLDRFKNILNAIEYDGVCCIDYKLQNGYTKIFEINARMGASLSEYISEALYAYAKALSIKC
ncbi:MAG: ATP-grasp domain-containing protein [Sulfurovaceae bacterium]|nr:ATP-grasp domain-containing protein [Sulfurovaceae bacterium]